MKTNKARLDVTVNLVDLERVSINKKYAVPLPVPESWQTAKVEVSHRILFGPESAVTFVRTR